MTLRPLCGPGLMAACLATLLCGCQLEQVQLGQSFIVYSNTVGQCSGLEWQFVVDAQRAISGTLLKDAAPIAKLSGTLAQDDTFRMAAAPLAGGPPSQVVGAFRPAVNSFTIVGDVAGPSCNGQTLVIQGPQRFQGNGFRDSGNR